MFFGRPPRAPERNFGQDGNNLIAVARHRAELWPFERERISGVLHAHRLPFFNGARGYNYASHPYDTRYDPQKMSPKWREIDTEQVLQGAPIIPDQVWGQKKSAWKVTKK